MYTYISMIYVIYIYIKTYQYICTHACVYTDTTTGGLRFSGMDCADACARSFGVGACFTLMGLKENHRKTIGKP